jgi:ribonuclease HI
METPYTTLTGVPVEAARCHLLQFDGGAVPNPGEGCGAAVIYSEEPRIFVFKGGTYLEKATNNQAEYIGLLFGLRIAVKAGVSRLLIEGDSQLVVFQVSRKWNVNNETLKGYHTVIHDLLSNFEYVGIRHVPRAYNKVADELSDEGIRRKSSFVLVKNV